MPGNKEFFGQNQSRTLELDIAAHNATHNTSHNATCNAAYTAMRSAACNAQHAAYLVPDSRDDFELFGQSVPMNLDGQR